MNLIKISTDLELSVHEFPTGTHEEQNNKLRELIGNDCRLYEHVMPKRLYTELHQMDHPTKVKGQCVRNAGRKYGYKAVRIQYRCCKGRQNPYKKCIPKRIAGVYVFQRW